MSNLEPKTETINNPREDVIAQSMRSANELISNLTTEEGRKTWTFVDEVDVCEGLKNLGKVAAIKNDTQGLMEQARRLEKLETLPGDAAGLYFLAASLGNEEAFEHLNGLLAVERAQADPSSLSPILNEVVEQCAVRDLPADAWINQYAGSNERAWRLRRRYFWAAKEAKQTQTPLAQQSLDIVLSQVLEDNFLPDEVVQEEIGSAIDMAPDAETKRRLLEHFKELTSRIGTIRFDVLARRGATIIDEPDLATAENVAWFESLIESGIHELEEKGFDQFDFFSTGYNWWQLKLAKYHGATPEELMDQIDAWSSSLLRLDVSEALDPKQWSTTVSRNKELVLNTRNGYLQDLAKQYMQKGNVAAACRLISHIGNEASRALAFKDCLNLAKSVEEIEALTPDEMVLMFEPDLVVQFEAAKILLSDDVDTMRQKAEELVNRNDNNATVIGDIIDKLVKRISDLNTAFGLEVVRSLVAILETKKASYWSLLGLRKILAEQAGDESQYQAMFEDINNAGRPAAELFYYTDLAKNLSAAA